LFYVETLADIAKPSESSRDHETIVGRIAEKTPVAGGTPCVYHSYLCEANLLGQPIPMTGQIPIAGGKFVKAFGKSAAVISEFPEADAFARWQRGEFLEIERRHASEWRRRLATQDLSQMASIFQKLGVSGKTCKSLDEAKRMADSLVMGRDNRFDRIQLAFMFLGIPEDLHREIIARWAGLGYPAIGVYAPYAGHVLTVEIFFQIALGANLISTERASNRVDVAYLFYLPFCGVFVSSDRLHQRCARSFLRQDQDFVWGQDLKAELQRINAHFGALPEETKEKGIMAFAHYPPDSPGSLMNHLWDRHLPRWRNRLADDKITIPVKSPRMADEIQRFVDAPALQAQDVDFDHHNPDALTIQRKVTKRRGSWYQLPKDLVVPDDER
jgi:hypothetical protein